MTRPGQAFLRHPLPALAVLDVLTRTLRRHSADAALHAVLSALAVPPEPASSVPWGTTADN
ncbi:hypothetical protein [Frankia sp. Cr1]|uniref:hypothetical protein n=1 Tax=Frankia sp. Cr1 TaxID=3073931 RepID=UPI002AD29923|nr:hypothetical protein [Frankia sp. Cr1]